MSDKTQPTAEQVERYLSGVQNHARRADARDLAAVLREATGAEPAMWGPSIVGFGRHHYLHETGRSGDTVAIGFSARKQALVLYGVSHDGQQEENVELAARLGPHSTGKGCLYIKKLSDVDLEILTMMVENAYKHRANA